MRIAEIFPTFQGEGAHTGVPMILVRTAGCNGFCPWCDTKYALKGGTVMTVPEVIRTCEKIVDEGYNTKRILLTGGEPALMCPGDQKALFEPYINWRFYVETNGTLPIALDYSYVWVCVSPKPEWTPQVNPDMIRRADEIKWIFARSRSGEELLQFIEDYKIPPRKVLVQPRWDYRLRKKAIEFALEHGFRLSFQVHKYAKWR